MTASSFTAAEDRAKLVAGNNAFGFDLYKKVGRGADRNVFLSPYSISAAVAMVYGGARENTARQIAEVAHFDLAPAALHPAFGALHEQINDIGRKSDVQLRTANGLWPQQDYEFLPEYLALVEKTYHAASRPVNFRDPAQLEKIRREINDWVEEQTAHKIIDLIQQGALDPLSKLVLVNAIYFKGRWAAEFDRKATQDQPFHREKSGDIDAPLMFREGRYGYAETNDCQLAVLPYKGDSLSMIVLLPLKDQPLAGLEEKLGPAALDRWLSLAKQQTIELYLPRFKVTAEYQLDRVLPALGMTDAFAAGKADFSGMDGKRELFISAAIHKAFVETNEEGTEAAAATGHTIALAGMPEPLRVFRADHPFIFIIRENESGAILFLGRLMDPKASG